MYASWEKVPDLFAGDGEFFKGIVDICKLRANGKVVPW